MSRWKFYWAYLSTLALISELVYQVLFIPSADETSFTDELYSIRIRILEHSDTHYDPIIS